MVHFVNIGQIVDHHCFNFLFHQFLFLEPKTIYIFIYSIHLKVLITFFVVKVQYACFNFQTYHFDK